MVPDVPPFAALPVGVPAVPLPTLFGALFGELLVELPPLFAGLFDVLFMPVEFGLTDPVLLGPPLVPISELLLFELDE